MAEILVGTPVANSITDELIVRAVSLSHKGVIPTLALVRVGNRADDVSYENAALNRCEKIGIKVKRFVLDEAADEKEILAVIDSINIDSGIHGAMVFRPLPKHLNGSRVFNALSPEKDVDGMTDTASLAVYSGDRSRFAPCTPQACIELLDYYGVELAGKNVAVIGRSMVIGKPCALLLLDRDATVSVCHSKSNDVSEICSRADIIVAAAGKARVIDRSYVRPGQIIVDVGIHVDENGEFCGDVDFDSVEPVVSAISPVPSGVAVLTAAVLAKHVIEAAENAQKNPDQFS